MLIYFPYQANVVKGINARHKGQRHYEHFEQSTSGQSGRSGRVVKVIKLTAEVEVGTRLGVFTVIFDRCLDSQQAWPSVFSTPRRRVFGTASNGPQSLMVIISNDNSNEMEEWSYRVGHFLLCAWESLQIVFFLIIPFWLKWEPVFAMMACAASSLCTIFVMLKWLWVSVSWVLWRPAKRQLFLWCDYDRCPSGDDLPQPETAAGERDERFHFRAVFYTSILITSPTPQLGFYCRWVKCLWKAIWNK